MIPAKGDFTQISVEMFSAHTMENAELGSFQKGAEGFAVLMWVAPLAYWP